MSVKLTAIVEGTLFVSTIIAKILMNVCRAEGHVLWVPSVITCLVDTNAVVLSAWTVIHILKDVDRHIQYAEGMRIASQ